MTLSDVPLLRLPVELLQHVLSFLDPYDVSAFAQTSKFANSLASPSNQLLWRYAFLKLFDDPSEAWAKMLPSARAANASIEEEWDWYFQLCERCIALKIMTTNDDVYRGLNMRRGIDVIVDIIATATYTSPETDFAEDEVASQSLKTLLSIFNDSPHAEKVIHSYEADVNTILKARDNENGSSSIYESRRPFTRSMSLHTGLLSENASRLHIYFGVTKHERRNPRARAVARRIVYDCETANEKNDFGPFKHDGSGTVDWKLLEAISSSIGYTFSLLALPRIRIPQGLQWSIPHILEKNPDCPDDWAGVTRRWIGTYSFLDYSVLHHLNLMFQRGHDPPLERIDEAHGDLLGLNLQLDDTIRDDPRLQTELPVCNDLPVLYFSGQSIISSNDTFSTVRGTVSLVPGGQQVRWRFIVRYSGADQWQLEGVQPGGVRSGGIFGRWTHCDHDEDGPVGPFCYFPEDLCISV